MAGFGSPIFPEMPGKFTASIAFGSTLALAVHTEVMVDPTITSPGQT